MTKMGSLGWRTRSQIPTLFVKKLNKMEKNENLSDQLKVEQECTS